MEENLTKRHKSCGKPLKCKTWRRTVQSGTNLKQQPVLFTILNNPVYRRKVLCCRHVRANSNFTPSELDCNYSLYDPIRYRR